jgi:hypothetical protein
MVPVRGRGVVGALSTAAALLGLVAILVIASAWHITQGTSGIGVRELFTCRDRHTLPRRGWPQCP